MFLNCGVGEDSWKSLGLHGNQISDPKENQPWIFMRRTDAKAKTPILWLPDVKNQLIGKDLDSWERLKAKGEGVSRGWDG